MNYNNLAQKTNWIAGSSEFKNIPFFLTNLNIPGVVLNHPEIGGRDSARIKLAGDTAIYNSLTFDMLIDEDFVIYQEVMSIIKKNVGVETGTFGNFYFDFFIEISNSKGNKVLKLDFSNCRIENISDIDLSSQDSSTEYTMSMEIVYDYYEIESTKRFALIQPTNDCDRVDHTFVDTFGEISDDWQLWGFPTPVINKEGISSNGTGNHGSGAINNGFQIDSTKAFEFTFRVKQELGDYDNDALFIDFGITEGIGIDSNINGRTGSTVMGVRLDRESVFESTNGTPTTTENDGEFHDYKFTYEIYDNIAEYKIYRDNILIQTSASELSIHDYFYLYFQGKEDNGVQVISRIIGKRGGN